MSEWVDHWSEPLVRHELERLLKSDIGQGIVLGKGRPASFTSTGLSACPRHALSSHEQARTMPIENARHLVKYLLQAEKWKQDNPDSDKSFFDHLYATP